MVILFEGLEGSLDTRDIISTLMVSARFLDKYRSKFKNKGFTINGTYTYKVQGPLERNRPRTYTDDLKNSLCFTEKSN